MFYKCYWIKANKKLFVILMWIEKYKKRNYSQFHKTLPKSSLQKHWIWGRFYEMGDSEKYFAFSTWATVIFFYLRLPLQCRKKRKETWHRFVFILIAFLGFFSQNCYPHFFSDAFVVYETLRGRVIMKMGSWVYAVCRL